MHRKKLVLAESQGRTAGLARGQGRVERAEVGPQNLGIPQGLIKFLPRHPRRRTMAKLGIAPEMALSGSTGRNAVGHAGQNLLVLQ